MFFYLLFLFLLKFIVYFTILFIVIVLGVKVWADPIKGVCKCKTKLHGKTALVTGGNAGIGLETARDLARRGARVIIASRNNKKSEAAVEDIKATTKNPNVEYRHLDLSTFKSIRRFCEEFNDKEERLDILVNNAGCAGLKKKTTENGIDLVTQINYLGPFLLTNLLLKKLTDSKPSRIVIVSSYAWFMSKFDPEDVAGLNTNGMWTRYCNTKLCNVLWAKALAKKLPQGITANSLYPGIVKTDIFDRLPAIPRKVVLGVIKVLFKTAKEGAQTSIHLSVAPELEDTSGKYYADCRPSAVPKEAKDDELIEKVWRESVRLTRS
ncbi:retinol dehydrogenase 12-like [Cydia amplana]|uniref:retinol dehydrogenase 12-like n=1 Tax=Cydia amplana TaxID=1869771 RepID=UPI002FE5CBCC